MTDSPTCPTSMPIYRQVDAIAGVVITTAIIFGMFGYDAGYVVALIGAIALALAGISGRCYLAKFLAFMPWNK